jgi:hypothetical protein
MQYVDELEPECLQLLRDGFELRFLFMVPSDTGITNHIEEYKVLDDTICFRGKWEPMYDPSSKRHRDGWLSSGRFLGHPIECQIEGEDFVSAVLRVTAHNANTTTLVYDATTK